VTDAGSNTGSRIELVVDLLARLASGDLAARGDRSERDDDIDAVIEGINMLAEDLEAGRAELEQRVQERTADLESVNADVLRLAELGNLLAACETADEAYAMISHGLSVMFDKLSGTMYLFRASRNTLEPRASWGELATTEPLDPRDCWALRLGRPHVVDFETPSLSCPHMTMRTGDTICIPMSAHGEIVGILHLTGHRASATGMSPLTTAKRQLAVPVAEQISLSLANLDLREMLRVQALRDPLTGLHNRRFADEWIQQEMARTDRNGRSLGVIMIDVDHFKQVNDLHGHDAGDTMLRSIAHTFEASLRPADMPCRYGGEEFLILLADIDLATLHDRAEELRHRVAELNVEYRHVALPPATMSAGIALYPDHGKTAEEVIQAADAALYQAKTAGRNRTVVAT
jgi:diguanylate cyclase (GGDEF)-like protein